MVSSLLVGVDDSTGAMTALRWAADVVATEQAEGRAPSAIMLAAWSRPAVEAIAIADDDDLEEAAADLLRRAAAELDDPEVFKQVVRRGHPARALIDEAAERDVDLIVVGSRGRSPIAQVLLGSTSRSVAASADRPVAIVPESAEIRPGPTVVGYNDSSGCRAAVRWALDNCHGEIKVVSAWTLPSSVVYDPAGVDPSSFDEQVREAMVTGLEAACGGSLDPRLTPIVQRDDPRLAILDPSLGAARIVIGARGERGLKGLVLGSTTTYVATHSSLPVIIVPPPDEDG